MPIALKQAPRDVGGVEELDGVGLLHAAAALAADGQVHAEALEVDDHQEDDRDVRDCRG